MQRGKREESVVDAPRRCLHLIFDGWGWGYSIHKIDFSSADNKKLLVPAAAAGFFPIGTSMSSSHSLPPHTIKIQALPGERQYLAVAFGSMILFLQPMNSTWLNLMSTPGMPVYDVQSRRLLIGPRPTKDPSDPIYLPVGGRLFALASGSFQLLYPPPSNAAGWEDFVWEWHALPAPPFQRQHVTSYAVHSDRRTIFVSTGGPSPATFSFDTAESARDTCMWKRHGEWQLPFHGRAYFAPELDAWVGLSGKPSEPDCRICSMDEIYDKCNITPHEGTIRFTKEELFSHVGAGRTIGATLVSLGGGSDFCIVECYHGEEEQGEEGPEVFARLMRFSLRYDKNGTLAPYNSSQLQYIVPPGVTEAMQRNPVAFWL